MFSGVWLGDRCNSRRYLLYTCAVSPWLVAGDVRVQKSFDLVVVVLNRENGKKRGAEDLEVVSLVLY